MPPAFSMRSFMRSRLAARAPATKRLDASGDCDSVLMPRLASSACSFFHRSCSDCRLSDSCSMAANCRISRVLGESELHFFWFLMIIMNQKKWSSLSPKTREILQLAAIEHESDSLQSLQDLWKKEQAELAKRGIKTLSQSPEASKRFVAGARAASLLRMKERMEKAGGMENYDRVVQLFTPG